MRTSERILQYQQDRSSISETDLHKLLLEIAHDMKYISLNGRMYRGIMMDIEEEGKTVRRAVFIDMTPIPIQLDPLEIKLGYEPNNDIYLGDPLYYRGVLPSKVHKKAEEGKGDNKGMENS
jgi:hypothetical protein